MKIAIFSAIFQFCVCSHFEFTNRLWNNQASRYRNVEQLKNQEKAMMRQIRNHFRRKNYTKMMGSNWFLKLSVFFSNNYCMILPHPRNWYSNKTYDFNPWRQKRESSLQNILNCLYFKMFVAKLRFALLVSLSQLAKCKWTTYWSLYPPEM